MFIVSLGRETWTVHSISAQEQPGRISMEMTEHFAILAVLVGTVVAPRLWQL